MRWLLALARLGVAAFSGLALYASFQPNGLWWGAPIGMILFFLTFFPWGTSGYPSKRFGALLAFAQGATFYLLLLPWVGVFVGAVPWVALSLVLAAYSAVWGAGLSIIVRYGAAMSSQRRATVWWMLTIPAWWASVEFARAHWPFGGFAWVRLGWGQIGGPLASIAMWGGPALVGLCVVVVGLSLSLLRLRRFGALVALVPVIVLAIPMLVPNLAGSSLWRPDPAPVKAEATVAAIQGNVPRLGLDFNAQRAAVLNNHIRESKRLSDQIEHGAQPQPDVVIWPENSSDIDPFQSGDAFRGITSAVSALGAPTLIGTITHPGDEVRNTIVVWDPKQGPQQRHDKIYLQPFGEYMPFRSFFAHFSSYVDQAGHFTPGTGNGVVQAPLADGAELPIGVATCYEVAFDQAYDDSIAGGAQLLVTPTNNATFGFTDMSYQQLAMSRMRALEFDRSVVVAATSGVSALITPEGDVVTKTRIFKPAALVDSLPLRTTITPAAVFATLIERTVAILGLVAMLLAAWGMRRRAQDHHLSA